MLTHNAHTQVHRVEEEVRQKVSFGPKDGLESITLDDVKVLVKNLKIGKALGLDGISNKANKCFSSVLLTLMVAIFNACLKKCYFSNVWNEAVVIVIPKPGKPRDLFDSYRPIKLLSSRAKLRLSDRLIQKSVIIDEQFGFRPLQSCPRQSHQLVEHILEGFKHKHKTVAVFFDIAMAFDMVAHAGLIYKLYNLEEKVNQSTFNGLTPGALSAHRCHLEVPTRVKACRDSLRRSDLSRSPVRESRDDGI
ncbi:Probable RNA-directed DNA polymerase from transposon BS [Eumeta japonica]|uniref:Probable RNA-directed DNA polymerase from transposon BS n=1 Tax=Eumeta variegata TaxID=151549 RepID=A0A4C1U8C6_EUMVA|nr:Probable RNA-directed DNA polymerase from transposon BS [Eumeta japonica]